MSKNGFPVSPNVKPEGGVGILALSRSERRQLVRLLGLLQENLECAIETSCIPGTADVMPEDLPDVAEDRKNWRAAENWIARLQGRKLASVEGVAVELRRRIKASGLSPAEYARVFNEITPEQVREHRNRMEASRGMA